MKKGGEAFRFQFPPQVQCHANRINEVKGSKDTAAIVFRHHQEHEDKYAYRDQNSGPKNYFQIAKFIFSEKMYGIAKDLYSVYSHNGSSA